MLEKYLNMEGFTGCEKIEGIDYVVVKKRMYTDSLFVTRFYVLKNENVIHTCDTKKQAFDFLKQLRMDLRDERIRATRENLERKGVNAYADHNGSMKQIMEAYRDYKGF